MQVLLSHAFSPLIMMIILATIDQNLHLFWKPKTTSLEVHGRSRYSNRTQKYHAEVVKKNNWKKLWVLFLYGGTHAVWRQFENNFFWEVRSRRAWSKTDCLNNKEERLFTYWRALKNIFSLHHEKRLLFLPNQNMYTFFFCALLCMRNMNDYNTPSENETKWRCWSKVKLLLQISSLTSKSWSSRVTFRHPPTTEGEYLIVFKKILTRT